jgi:hypothetical protein
MVDDLSQYPHPISKFVSLPGQRQSGASFG